MNGSKRSRGGGPTSIVGTMLAINLRNYDVSALRKPRIIHNSGRVEKMKKR